MLDSCWGFYGLDLLPERSQGDCRGTRQASCRSLNSKTIRITNQKRKESSMTDTKPIPGGLALKAALAILKDTVTPLKRPDGGGNVTAGNLAETIERETHVTELLDVATRFLACEIEYRPPKRFPSEENTRRCCEKGAAAVRECESRLTICRHNHDHRTRRYP